MRKYAARFALLALVLAAASPAGAASWAQPQIRTAVESGLMGPSVAAFRPNDPLTRGELAVIRAGLSGQQVVVTDPSRAVTMTELNRSLVNALGLTDAALEFRGELAATGLAPVERTGGEIVARLLGFRFNHPAANDGRELQPNDPATRAEAAYTVARILSLSSWDLDRARERAVAFDLSPLTTWQDRVLQRAARFIGFPYIWGGTSEWPQTLFGVASGGGFDCSGFVWRVYKLERWSGAPLLGTTIRQRTAAGMAGEIPKRKRIPRVNLRPGDLMFFGSRGPQTPAVEINHAAIYMGGGWLIQSSGQGVTLAPFDGWYANTFAWGRRPLAEVGLR